MQDHAIIAVPNRMIAESVVVNRSRAPHWSVGSASPLLASPRDLRFRMKLPHAALDKLEVRRRQQWQRREHEAGTPCLACMHCACPTAYTRGRVFGMRACRWVPGLQALHLLTYALLVSGILYWFHWPAADA